MIVEFVVGPEAIYILAAYAKSNRDDVGTDDRRALSKLVATIRKAERGGSGIFAILARAVCNSAMITGRSRLYRERRRRDEHPPPAGLNA